MTHHLLPVHIYNLIAPRWEELQNLSERHPLRDIISTVSRQEAICT